MNPEAFPVQEPNTTFLTAAGVFRFQYQLIIF